jgi:predicted PurR-regulated permease PerM
MRPIYWAIAAAIGILLVGLIFGIAGVFLAPILGGIALIALLIWLLGRKARNKPPVP